MWGWSVEVFCSQIYTCCIVSPGASLCVFRRILRTEARLILKRSITSREKHRSLKLQDGSRVLFCCLRKTKEQVGKHQISVPDGQPLVQVTRESRFEILMGNHSHKLPRDTHADYLKKNCWVRLKWKNGRVTTWQTLLFGAVHVIPCIFFIRVM